MLWHLDRGLTRLDWQERLERLGTGWMGAVFEWEGVVVEERGGAHREVRKALP
jgi:hypothetical protein